MIDKRSLGAPIGCKNSEQAMTEFKAQWLTRATSVARRERSVLLHGTNFPLARSDLPSEEVCAVPAPYCCLADGVEFHSRSWSTWRRPQDCRSRQSGDAVQHGAAAHSIAKHASKHRKSSPNVDHPDIKPMILALSQTPVPLLLCLTVFAWCGSRTLADFVINLLGSTLTPPWLLLPSPAFAAWWRSVEKAAGPSIPLVFLERPPPHQAGVWQSNPCPALFASVR